MSGYSLKSHSVPHKIDLKVRWNIPLPEPEVRDATDLKTVLARPGCTLKGPVYYMYRDVASSAADRWWLKRSILRYDITVIPPCKLCGEFVKTKGHYHPDSPSGVGYPEIYEVLEGKAHYLLQSHNLSDVVMIKAIKGDVIIVPPGYGHITINPTQDTVLKMANIVSSAFESNYQDYEDLKGAAYYEMDDGKFVKNPAYPKVPALRIVTAKTDLNTRVIIPPPIYGLIERRNATLGLLNHPEKFESLFQNLNR
jgi:glucose-6-phosphate isomerase